MILNLKENNRRADFIKYYKNTYGLFLDFHKYGEFLLITLRQKRNDIVEFVGLTHSENVKFFAPKDLEISDELADDLRSSFC